MEKMLLNYRTKTDRQSPQGKPKVFFTCHENDFNSFFDTESKAILWADENIDCAIWYNSDAYYYPSGNESKEDYYTLLYDMNLFVIPVTLNFLKGNNRAYDVDFRYALDHNIPLLMIMEEHGLEDLFETMCGQLQYLDRYQDMTTQDSYENKLKKYLNDTLISCELSEKIRAAFDAYIFLSYRKKDRKEALKVMETIHKNDFMRDIAIWFDENLIPGENFSDAIKSALQKSTLFTLVVTPSINEHPNYVMNEEYPLAFSSGKNILAIEAKTTDKNTLKSNFNGLEHVLPIDEAGTISDKLIELLKKEAYKENDDPEHLYYIALAYLYGIDVEKNVSRGVSILKKSASSDYEPSIKKLVHIFLTGEGVKVSYDTALLYQKQLVKIYTDNKVEDTAILDAENNLANLYSNLGDYEHALDLYEQVYCSRKETLGEDNSDTLISLNNIAATYDSLMNYTQALKIHEQIYNKSADKFGEDNPLTLISLNNLAAVYGKLGDDEKSLELNKQAYYKVNQVFGVNHPNAVLSLNNLAAAYAKLGDYTKAIELYEKAYDKACDIFGKDHPQTFIAENNMATVYSNAGDYKKALELHEQVYSKRKEILGDNHPKTLLSLNSMANDLAEAYNSVDNCLKTIEFHKQIYDKSKEILGNNHQLTLTFLSNLAFSYVKAGDDKKSRELYEQLYSVRKEVLGEDHPDTMTALSNLAVSLGKLGDYEKAFLLHNQIYPKREKILGENHAKTLLSLNELAFACMQLGDYKKASEFYSRLYHKQKEVFGKKHPDTLQSRRNLADSRKKSLKSKYTGSRRK